MTKVELMQIGSLDMVLYFNDSGTYLPWNILVAV